MSAQAEKHLMLLPRVKTTYFAEFPGANLSSQGSVEKSGVEEQSEFKRKPGAIAGETEETGTNS
jgi:hypothetical protein